MIHRLGHGEHEDQLEEARAKEVHAVVDEGALLTAVIIGARLRGKGRGRYDVDGEAGNYLSKRIKI